MMSLELRECALRLWGARAIIDWCVVHRCDCVRWLGHLTSNESHTYADGFC
jgi:hypothetical protein